MRQTHTACALFCLRRCGRGLRCGGRAGPGRRCSARSLGGRRCSGRFVDGGSAHGGWGGWWCSATGVGGRLTSAKWMRSARRRAMLGHPSPWLCRAATGTRRRKEQTRAQRGQLDAPSGVDATESRRVLAVQVERTASPLVTTGRWKRNLRGGRGDARRLSCS